MPYHVVCQDSVNINRKLIGCFSGKFHEMQEAADTHIFPETNQIETGTHCRFQPSAPTLGHFCIKKVHKVNHMIFLVQFGINKHD